LICTHGTIRLEKDVKTKRAFFQKFGEGQTSRQNREDETITVKRVKRNRTRGQYQDPRLNLLQSNNHSTIHRGFPSRKNSVNTLHRSVQRKPRKTDVLKEREVGEGLDEDAAQLDQYGSYMLSKSDDMISNLLAKNILDTLNIESDNSNPPPTPEDDEPEGMDYQDTYPNSLRNYIAVHVNNKSDTTNQLKDSVVQSMNSMIDFKTKPLLHKYFHFDDLWNLQINPTTITITTTKEIARYSGRLPTRYPKDRLLSIPSVSDQERIQGRDSRTKESTQRKSLEEVIPSGEKESRYPHHDTRNEGGKRSLLHQ
jgi:hypothetical protein